MNALTKKIGEAIGTDVGTMISGNGGPGGLYTVELGANKNGEDVSFRFRAPTEEEAFLRAARRLVEHFGVADKVIIPEVPAVYKVRVWQDVEVIAVSPQDAQHRAAINAQYHSKMESWQMEEPEILCIVERSEPPETSDQRADREAEEDFQNGTGVPLSEVRAWVDSWGTDNKLPRPQVRPMPRS